MNTDNTTAIDLLDTAREVLLDTLLPTLDKAHHYECRMIARAMAVAARQIARGADAERIEAGAVAALLDDQQATTADARARLAGLIRSGAFDHPDERQQRLLEALLRINRARLAITSPKAVRNER
ncbi:DUF6285 domain-containing protein [Pseudomonas sp. BJa5]|uniref:DUF6285 domain-containing protein n=1 Tax=Pseudomonas sp. BJa5 TaxID=2936270 RepID=UPI002559C86E|nr:DUF6285 domain-containing protein [Pseudomonas sp. BGr12]MDL2424124.1 DUF6285 domain-containing protein [Pseudomonas sp. BGr12]